MGGKHQNWFARQVIKGHKVNIHNFLDSQYLKSYNSISGDPTQAPFLPLQSFAEGRQNSFESNTCKRQEPGRSADDRRKKSPIYILYMPSKTASRAQEKTRAGLCSLNRARARYPSEHPRTQDLRPLRKSEKAP